MSEQTTPAATAPAPTKQKRTRAPRAASTTPPKVESIKRVAKAAEIIAKAVANLSDQERCDAWDLAQPEPSPLPSE